LSTPLVIDLEYEGYAVGMRQNFAIENQNDGAAINGKGDIMIVHVGRTCGQSPRVWQTDGQIDGQIYDDYDRARHNCLLLRHSLLGVHVMRNDNVWKLLEYWLGR